jgi:hypothetical protein
MFTSNGMISIITDVLRGFCLMKLRLLKTLIHFLMTKGHWAVLEFNVDTKTKIATATLRNDTESKLILKTEVIDYGEHF